jgi:hypothetical protein
MFINASTRALLFFWKARTFAYTSELSETGEENTVFAFESVLITIKC